MTKPALLLARLDAIAASLAARPDALALLGLGSVGRERERLDAYSDLDFFVLVSEGAKGRYVQNLDWLTEIRPVVFQFQNTADGYKLLFDDGVFCEFAVFELSELGQIPYSPGHIVWKREEVPDSVATPAVPMPAPPAKPDVDWALGEALTNLYVGLGRYRRGEKLSAFKFVQSYALDRVVDLANIVFAENDAAQRDRFDRERRIEARLPGVEDLLASLALGYARTPEAALAILDFLEARFEVNAALAEEIRRLANST
ncbi:MAG: hypothetical protein RLY93_17355 [Sumerlaeia bacterium]